MWFLLSLLAAVFYAALWVLARASRGLPTSIVLAAEFSPVPLLVLFGWPSQPVPWDQPLWIFFVCVSIFFMPVTWWLMTYAGQRSDIGVIKPLSSLSSITALVAGVLIFHDQISFVGGLGVMVVLGGLLVLYRGRSYHWSKRYPWIVLFCVLSFGFIGALLRSVLQMFPEPLFVTGIFLLPGGLLYLLQAVRVVRSIRFTASHYYILIAFAIASITQEVASIYALTLAPAAYMYTVKRTSIIIASLIGYFYFHEKEVPLWRLTAGSIVVVGGTAVLAFAH